MPEWLYEAGIGEARAALVDGDRIVQALIEPEQSGPRLGTVSKARIAEITTKGREARITLADGSEATLSPLPPGITQGASLSVKIVREAIPESGRRHHCLSAVCVIGRDGKARTRISDTIVAFKPLSASEIDAYVASGEGMGKAGGYAIQGRAEAWVRFLSGSHSGVVGLPLFETRALLTTAGIPFA